VLLEERFNVHALRGSWDMNGFDSSSRRRERKGRCWGVTNGWSRGGRREFDEVSKAGGGGSLTA